MDVAAGESEGNVTSRGGPDPRHATSCQTQQAVAKDDSCSIETAISSRVVQEWNGRRSEGSLVSSDRSSGVSAGARTTNADGSRVMFPAKEIKETLGNYLESVRHDRQVESERQAEALRTRLKQTTVEMTHLEERDARLQAEIRALQHEVGDRCLGRSRLFGARTDIHRSSPSTRQSAMHLLAPSRDVL